MKQGRGKFSVELKKSDLPPSASERSEGARRVLNSGNWAAPQSSVIKIITP